MYRSYSSLAIRRVRASYATVTWHASFAGNSYLHDLSDAYSLYPKISQTNHTRVEF